MQTDSYHHFIDNLHYVQLLCFKIGMASTSLGEPDNDPEHDKYTLATGCCVMLLGKSQEILEL